MFVKLLKYTSKNALRMLDQIAIFYRHITPQQVFTLKGLYQREFPYAAVDMLISFRTGHLLSFSCTLLMFFPLL